MPRNPLRIGNYQIGGNRVTPKKSNAKPWEQALLGVVSAGGGIAKGASGLVGMAADGLTKKADEHDSGKRSLVGAAASMARPMISKISEVADREHKSSGKTISKIEPDLGSIGEKTKFASSLIPGARALDIPLAVGESKRLNGGFVPTLASLAASKLKIGTIGKNAVQQAVGDLAKKKDDE